LRRRLDTYTLNPKKEKERKLSFKDLTRDLDLDFTLHEKVEKQVRPCLTE